MKTLHLSSLVMAAAVLGLTACADSTSSSTLFDDAAVTTDVANSSGDAMATSLEVMLANEATVALPSAPIAATSPTDNTLTFNRSRTCYDVNGAVVAGCSPASSVRRIVSHVSVDGSRSGSTTTTGGTNATWTGAVHRVADDTVTRNYTGASELSRTHSGVSVGHDTTTFTDANVSRKASEVAHDAHKNITWNLPRSSNPFPISGQIVRVDSVHVTVTKGTNTETRDVVRTVQVDFPADAQGNVSLKVNGKTCNLNLVTHVVGNCS